MEPDTLHFFRLAVKLHQSTILSSSTQNLKLNTENSPSRGDRARPRPQTVEDVPSLLFDHRCCRCRLLRVKTLPAEREKRRTTPRDGDNTTKSAPLGAYRNLLFRRVTRAELHRGTTEATTEEIAERCRALESHIQTDVGDRAIGDHQKIAGMIQTKLCQILMGRDRVKALEETKEVVR